MKQYEYRRLSDPTDEQLTTLGLAGFYIKSVAAAASGYTFYSVVYMEREVVGGALYDVAPLYAPLYPEIEVSPIKSSDFPIPPLSEHTLQEVLVEQRRKKLP